MPPATTLLPEQKPAGPQPWLVIALCAIYLLAGLAGHDPWKSEDAIHLAVAHGFFTSADWSMPTLAGEPWPEAEPLYHWLAAVSASLLGGLLPFHEGARLATALFGGLFLALLAGAARRLYGVDAAWGAPLLAIGTLGLLVPLHEAQPAAASLAAMAAVYWGASLLAERPLFGSLAMGTGLGAGFLAGGLNAALPLSSLLLLPLLQRRWTAFAIAACLGVLLASAWPVLLLRQQPAFLDAWWGTELASITPHGLSVGHAQWLGWFAWPVLFVAPWALWRGRRQLSTPGILLPLLGSMAALAWFLVHEAKVAATLPLLPPLILLAASGTARLRRGAANGWDWFGMMTFTIVAALVWLGATAMLSGWPPKIAHNFAKLEPGFIARFSLPAMLVAAAATIGWIMVLARSPRSPWRAASRWAAGVTVVWVLLAALWMPWIDYGKTYRPVVMDLRRALPADEPGCIARRGVGAPQRAALDYFAGIRTRTGSKNCQWLVVQGGGKESAPAGWHKIWEGHRPGDRSEWLRLYKRD